MARDVSVQLLLDLIDEAFDRKAWHGTTLFGSIRGMTADRAAWRPAPRRHNVWELVVHAAYWKYAVWRRLTGVARGSFPLTGSNWLVRPVDMTDRAWRADLALLEDVHRTLRAALAACTSRDLKRRAPGSSVSNRALITGIAAHDLYHAGQIQLLKRLSGVGARRRRPGHHGEKTRSSHR